MAYVKEGLIISRITRLFNSANGNPRHEVVFTDGTSARTAVDANIGDMITNSEYANTPLCVVFNPHGDISNVTRLDGKR